MQDRLKALGNAILIHELGGADYPTHLRTVSDAEESIAELQERLDAEMRLAGDLEAALRLVSREMEQPMSTTTRVQLAAYVNKELKRLRG